MYRKLVIVAWNKSLTDSKFLVYDSKNKEFIEYSPELGDENWFPRKELDESKYRNWEDMDNEPIDDLTDLELL
jgi:hypothetical protein